MKYRHRNTFHIRKYNSFPNQHFCLCLSYIWTYLQLSNSRWYACVKTFMPLAMLWHWYFKIDRKPTNNSITNCISITGDWLINGYFLMTIETSGNHKNSTSFFAIHMKIPILNSQAKRKSWWLSLVENVKLMVINAKYIVILRYIIKLMNDKNLRSSMLSDQYYQVQYVQALRQNRTQSP